MKSLKSTYFLLPLVLLLTSCFVSREQKAQELYDEALNAFSAHKMAHSKILVDSLQSTYPDLPKVQIEARDLRRTIVTFENRRTLAFLDSLLQVKQQEIAPLMKDVDIDDKHAVHPVFVHNLQRTWRGISRCYIRAFAEQNGNFYISSNFVGERAIHHNHIRVDAPDAYILTDSVSDAAFLHSFSDGEYIWEIVRYKGQEAANVAQLIASAQPSDRIMITYQGPRAHYKSLMTDVDKKAVAHIWQLSVLLRETAQIKSKIRQTRIAIGKNK